MDKIERDVHVERYFPDVLAAAKELKALAAAENLEYKLLYENAWRWFANTFVFHTDLEGVKKWESMLGLYPDVGATLEDRRAAIYLAINGTTPYTEKSFKSLCDGMYHKDAVIPVVHPQSYTLILNLDGDMVPRLEIIKRYARLIVPANLTIQTAHTIEMNAWGCPGGVVRKVATIEVGRDASDIVDKMPITSSIAIPIFEVNSSEDIAPTAFGIMPGYCFEADAVKITPTKIEPNEVHEDTLFKIDDDDRIVVKGEGNGGI